MGEGRQIRGEISKQEAGLPTTSEWWGQQNLFSKCNCKSGQNWQKNHFHTLKLIKGMQQYENHLCLEDCSTLAKNSESLWSSCQGVLLSHFPQLSPQQSFCQGGIHHGDQQLCWWSQKQLIQFWAVGDAQSYCRWNRRSWQQSVRGELRLCLSLQSLMRPLGCMCVQLRSEGAEGTHILLPTLRLWACAEVMWRVQQTVKARANLKNLKTIWTLIAFPYLLHIY